MNDTPRPADSGDEIEIAEGRNCAQCQVALAAGEGVATQNALFCSDCYGQLTEAVTGALAEQGRHINWLGALLGGVLGGLLGAGVWWGFTVVTRIQFGLVAVVIGWAAGKGVLTFSGHKRALPLQLMSVAITLVSYVLASYWVTRTYVHRYIAENGMSGSLPLLPSPGLLVDVVTSGFEVWTLVFLAIALWQAWKMPAPIVLRHPE